MNNNRRCLSRQGTWLAVGLVWTLIGHTATVTNGSETAARVQIAAASFEDAIVVDCQLPGRLQRLGGMRTYLSPGALARLTAIDCRTRGGEYTVGNLASGTFSLKRWLPLAEQGNAEAQYYVARIYANGMDDVPMDLAKAADWYKKAAAQKYASAQQELGFMYERGLGVQKDELLALNLQRQASGLGDSLDYSWKIAATKEEAAAKIAAVSNQLDTANSELEALRGQILATNDALGRGRDELEAAEATVRSLRTQLASARQANAAADPALVARLQQQLSGREAELQAKQKSIDDMTATLDSQRSALTSQSGASQTENARLNQLLASRNAESQALSAKLAQSEMRLLQTQQELTEARSSYDQEARLVVSQREQLSRAQGQSSAGATEALLAGRQRDADQLKAQLATQTAELQRLRTASAAGGSAPDKVRQQELTQQLAALQQRYDTLQAQNQRLASRSRDEQSTALKQVGAELDTRSAQLDERQKTIQSLQQENERQRTALEQLRQQSSAELAKAHTAADTSYQQARAAVQQLNAQREEIERLKNESMAVRVTVDKDREQLAAQQQLARAADQRQISMLQANIQEKETLLRAKSQRVEELEQSVGRSSNNLVAGNVSYRMPQALNRSAAPDPALMGFARTLEPAHYYALIIGNSEYQRVGKLTTPKNDAFEIAELLQQRYGFTVKTLYDATQEQIVMALHGYAQDLTDSDRLLIYYAGHGGTSEGPPDRAFWWGVEADPVTQNGWLSAELVRSKIKQINARHILVVSDSCFSSALTNPRSTTVLSKKSEDEVRIQWRSRASLVLTSGQNTPVVDSAGDRRHSLFASYFIKILRQNQTLLSGANLAAEIDSQIRPEAQRLGVVQQPTYTTLLDANHKFGDFYFLPMTSETQMIAAVTK